MSKKEAILSDDDVSSEEEGEDLILEGVLIRNPEVESSSDDDDDDTDNGDNDTPKKKKARIDTTEKKSSSKQKKKQSVSKQKKVQSGPEIINVEFTFNDMREGYFHGMKNFLLNQPIYAPYASAFTDLMIENVSVGTVVSTEDGEDNVFGFASVLNVTTYKDKPCMEFLKKKCLESCPKQHKKEMETVLSGSTKRPAGVLIHGRMINLPLEITEVLHEQLVEDMDWAVENADGGEGERKSLNFGAFIILAPCSRNGSSHSTMYVNFDDEIFAGCAEFVFPMNMSGIKGKAEEASKNDEGDSNQVDVLVLTKDGHRKAMTDIKALIQG